MELLFCFILSLLQVGKIINDCPSTVFRDVQGFGPECRYRCNCKNRHCNNVTGECLNGCLSGWMGPACQYRNMAAIINRGTLYHIPRSHPSNSEYAYYAIDSNEATCSRTGLDNPSLRRFWHAEFQFPTYIVGCTLKIKSTDTELFRGFSINVGNDTDHLETCYHHGESSDGQMTMDINCEKRITGRFFRISFAENEFRDLALCEVEIYGGRLVSFNKPTDIHSTLEYKGQWNSYYAVDGRHPLGGENQDNATVRTCAATADTQASNKWWMVNLNSVYSIIGVSFYGRDERKDQFDRFVVKVGLNETSLQLFFDDNPPATSVSDYLPKSKNLTWPLDGAVARVERNGSIFVICELEVFADCKYGMCGWECNETCMCSHQTTGTHKILGDCPHGCTGRWTGLGEKCNIECDQAKWGPFCNNTCGNCNDNDSCDVRNGFCPGSCEPGWKPPYCSEECSIGTYGTNCTFECGKCMGTKSCNRTTGICESGCQPGYRGQLCIDKCENGTYGDGCKNICGRCLFGDACHYVTGECPRGCDAGYQGQDCNTTCDVNQFGLNCSEKCGYCSNGESCNHETGICAHGCQPGWETKFCNKSCDDGFYGAGCANNCGNCFNNTICTPVNGSCPGGCAEGYHGTVCKTNCTTGWYGINCATKCGDCDSVQNCDRKTGMCTNGCLPGWQGSYCKDPCEDTFYGMNCNNTCGYCRNREPCDKTSGHCRACEPGYQMNTCTEICVSGMYGENCAQQCGSCAGIGQCNITNGICPLGCSDGFTGPLCTENAVSTPGNKIPIIGGVVGAVIALAVAAVAVLTFIKRGYLGQKCAADKKESTFNDLELTDDLQKNVGRAMGKQSIPIPEEPNSDGGYTNAKAVNNLNDNSITIPNIRAKFHSAKREPNFLYSEFKEIPYGLNGDASEAKMAVYKSKNRYREMYPYNANRVHLPEIPGSPSSTYINASYINGYVQSKKYIAAQGAIQATINDIWRMVWSENISIIVMLTKCVELGKMKCELYWPEESSLEYGTIFVELITVEEYADFVVRTFKCTNVPLKVSRTVVHFHYTAWPDKDVPETALSIVQFWRMVREHNPVNKILERSPWLVHCSAGVGRTGTFIAMDVLFDQGQTEGKMNIKETVYRLREQRLNMVQTKEQYVFLHNIMADILEPIGTVCKSEEFSDVYRQLTSNKATNKQKLFMEYQQLCKATDELYQGYDEADTYCNVVPNTCGQLMDCKLPENVCKSRNLQIHIDDRHRPRLCTAAIGCNDFINAVYIPTYRYRDHIILTQCPLENTVIDFIRMVWDCSVTDVVYLEEKLQKDEEAYWPVNRERKEVGSFRVELVSERTTASFTYRILRFTHAANKQQKEIRQYHFHHWPQNKEIPADTANMLRLISAVDDQFRKQDDSRLVIQCLDGAKRSGVFCVVYSLLERLKMDKQVAVAETVIQARTKRRQIIDNFEQYKYCYDVIEDHLQSNNVYANLA